ncbi:multiple ankyrin repeats single kh domain-containing protein [Colletotrichum kahawae]|uniref:Multiple ankyrin repeats single kh domain-containing protein n=1 Tax=Colletotrichum kahawae TaxID=34407 RepID=A0AAD9Y6M2_COLKA|nr:multiple ankyrin repeats single kh domain-containing protein [Colletotrichum kahawae]
MAAAISLWDKAFDTLGSDVKSVLSSTRSHRRDILQLVLEEAESKRDLAAKKRWKFTTPNNKTMIVRDVLEKITAWVQRFVATGDTVVQYDPGHAALPWAAVRFLLQIAVSEVQMFGALVDDLEHISRMMVRYRAFEKLYLDGSHPDIEEKLQETVNCLYAEILKHLSKAVSFFNEKTFAFTRLSLQSSSTIAEQLFNEIVEWLSVAPYYHHHHFLAQSRLQGAGRWLLNHEGFVNWESSSSSSLLLIHGIPGSGKSTLCSIIIDHLLSNGTANANSSMAPFGYFYCANPGSERMRRTVDDVMRTILFQLAIDSSDRTKLRDVLSEEYKHQILRSRAGKLDLPRLKLQNTRKRLRSGLLAGAGEMFLWAKLQIDRISRETIEDDVVIALQNESPKDINSLYQRVLVEISEAGPSSRDIAFKVLSWVLYMREPLTPPAFLAALRISHGSSLSLRQALTTCFNLVILDTACSVVRFTHQSVQDFLVQHSDFTPAEAHCLLASCCLEVSALGRDPASDQGFEIPSDDLYVYASMFWPVHAESSLCLDQSMAQTKALNRQIIEFIFDEEWELTLAFELWIESIREIVILLPTDHAMRMKLEAIPANDAAVLSLLSAFDIYDILVTILSLNKAWDIDIQNELGQTPIYLASTFGHPNTVNLLVQHDARVDVEGGGKGSPLHSACYWGHLTVVQILLVKGAQLSCGSVFKSAYDAAIHGGKEDVAMFLIEIDALIETYEQALAEAALMGFTRVVQKLQNFSLWRSGENQNVPKTLKYRKAVEGGQVGILRQLLKRNTSILQLLGPDAIALATAYNQKNMVEYLLDQKMDLEAQGDFGSPLRTACLLNHLSIARLLLDRGAQINATGPLGHALQAAALRGNSAMVKILVHEGADFYQKSGSYGSALQAAAYHGHLDTVDLLLDACWQGEALQAAEALQSAAEGGQPDVLMLISRRHKHILPPKMRGRLLAAPVTPWQGRVLDWHLGRAPYYGTERFEQPNLLTNAAASGHDLTVKWLLDHQHGSLSGFDLWSEIPGAIVAASEKHYMAVLYILFDYISNEGNRNLLELNQENTDSDVNNALALASKQLSDNEVIDLGRKYRTAANKYSTAEVNARDVNEDFSVSCVTENKYLADSILSSEHQKSLSAADVDGCLQLCGLHGQTGMARLILDSMVLQDRIPLSGVEAFVAAAAGDAVDSMQLFLARWSELRTVDEALGRALVVASDLGQVAAVRYLAVDLGVNVNLHAPDIGFGPLLNDNGERLQVVRNPEQACSRQIISPLQAGLQGYAYKFSLDNKPNGIEHSRLKATKSVKGGGKDQQEEAINLLLQRGAHPNDLGGQRMYPIHITAKYCPENILHSLIIAGADVSLRGLDAPSKTDIGGSGSDGPSETSPMYGISWVRSPTPELPSFAEARQLTFHSTETPLFEVAGRRAPGSHVRHLVLAAALPQEEAGERARLMVQMFSHVPHDSTPRLYEGTRYFNEERREENYGFFAYDSPPQNFFSKGPGAILEILMDHVPAIITMDPKWEFFLQMAVSLGRDDLTSCLISCEINANAVSEGGGTCLQIAARYGHVKTAQTLLEAGADVNATGGEDFTALRAALRNGNHAVANLLLGYGADVRIEPSPESGSKMQSTLQLAVRTANVDCVSCIFANGASLPLHTSEDYEHPLIIAARRGYLQIVEFLIGVGAPVNVVGKVSEDRNFAWFNLRPKSGTPLHAAVLSGHLDVIDLLLNVGADIEATNGVFATPLTTAASKGNAAVARHLVEAGASVDDGVALDEAIQLEYIDVVEVIAHAGPVPLRAVTTACKGGNVDVIQLLLDKLSSDGTTTAEAILDFAFAARGLEQPVTDLLLEYAEPTPSQFIQVCKTGSAAAVEHLLRRDYFDANTLCKASGNSPLQFACLHLRAEVVEVLLAHGADVDFKSTCHGTPLDTALETCAAPILRFLNSENLSRSIEDLSLPQLLPTRGFVVCMDAQCDRATYEAYQERRKSLEDCENIANLLIAQGADVIRPIKHLGTPLHFACLLGLGQIVEALLDKGMDINATAGQFGTPLLAAIQPPEVLYRPWPSSEAKYDVAVLILKHHPDLNYIHIEYGTALHHACRLRNGRLLEELLKHGADATVKDANGVTSLTLALEIESRLSNSILLKDNTERHYDKHSHSHDSESSDSIVTLDDEYSPLNDILNFSNSISISDQDILKASRMPETISIRVLSRLLCLDQRKLASSSTQPIDAVELLFQHDLSVKVTMDIFLHIIQTGEEVPLRLLDLYEVYGKPLPPKDDIHAALDNVSDSRRVFMKDKV